jgi:hypothetical protein
MERAAWTDERLDDLARRMDAGFERIDARIDSVGDRLDARIDGLGSSLNARIDALAGRIDALQVAVLRFGAGMMIGFIGLIAAVLVRG